MGSPSVGRAERVPRRRGPWPVARRKRTQLSRVRTLRELSIPPGNRLERLTGERAGQHSVRINEQYRVCFRWEKGHADEVEVTDDHWRAREHGLGPPASADEPTPDASR